MVVRTEDGRYVDLSCANVVTVPIDSYSKEERKELYKIQTEKHKQKLAEERNERSVSENKYHIGTIKKIFKNLGYELITHNGGYKGNRFAGNRNTYDVVETFGEQRIILLNKNYFELGRVLEDIGAM